MDFLVEARRMECLLGDVLSPLSADVIETRERRRLWLCAGSAFYLIIAFAGLFFIK